MNNFAKLKNVGRALSLAESLIERPAGLPGIGVFSGFSGLGKTFASIYVQNAYNAARIEVGESWSKKKLLQAILHELGVFNPRGSIADLADQAKMRLAEDIARPLIVDEADKLVDKNLIEIVRELADVSGAPILLIGEEALPNKLQKFERVHNRVKQFMLAEPCDDDDFEALRAIYAEKLCLNEDLKAQIKSRSYRIARRIAVNLNRAQDVAINSGAMELDLKTFLSNGGEFYTGEAPVRPREQRH